MMRRGGASPYSRLVATLKVALPTLAVVLLSLVVVWPQLNAGPDKSSPLTFARLAAPQQQTQTMLDARYHGTDGSNQPYTVTAEMAKETEPGSHKVRLTRPRADITLRSGAWVLLEADEGLYDQASQVLELSGTVNVFHDAGYEMHTTRLLVDMAKSEVTGPEPVTGRGPRGELSGQGLRITEAGKVVAVTGKSRLLGSSAASSPKKVEPKKVEEKPASATQPKKASGK
ncbi:LPS export ABC transporter periplasmic protein LptC [Novispirillum itersonii]|uniref:Lipopolysaccharide export system protein LptC n=1 Tax=Novispirillum itersonii TaxID=189 RepID=A0A7W9ZCU2_NOVIT|nr:LPS export ABC transporter periplasmic protein LptC [Novispirillum itersonii]MBB6209061.1 lipopolysaccharide export system protein LptC [Novispirillum itersonii]